MIAANPGWFAYFKGATAVLNAKQVEAWDDEGRALVIDGKAGRLRPAWDYTNFSHVGRPDEGPYISAVPGQGWQIKRTFDDDTVVLEPVIAFAIDKAGSAEVLVGMADGLVEPEVDADGKKVALIPPGGWGKPS